MMLLMPKELLIVRLVTAGLTNADIAKAVGNTTYTLKNKLVRIFDKTGMDTRLQLALWYLAKRKELESSCRQAISSPIASNAD
jgi:two-component system nitrate/nitrite response regulator NarL